MKLLFTLLTALPLAVSAHGQHPDTEGHFSHGFFHAVISFEGLFAAAFLALCVYFLFKK
jgi:hypothetical protein